MFSFAAAGFAFTFGCFIGCFLKSSMILPSFIIFGVISIVLFIFRKKLMLLFTVSLFLFLSFSVMLIHNSLNLPSESLLGEGEYIGVVDEINYSYYDRTYTVRLTEGKLKDRKVSIGSVYSRDISKGDKVKFKGDIKEYVSELGFDEKTKNASKGVFLVSEVKYSSDLICIERNTAKDIREEIAKVFSVSLHRNLPDYAAELSDAMLLGNRETLSDYVTEGFRITGGSHFLAVSGLHLSVLISFVGKILDKLRVKRTVSDILVVLFLVFYMFITGFRFSVMRSGIMALFIILARFSGRLSESVTSLSFAGFVICLFNPYAAADIGFILSFSATLGIILVVPYCEKFIEKYKIQNSILKALTESLTISLAACVFTVPFSMCYFGSLSVVTLLTSTSLTIPVTLIISLGLIVAVFGLILPSLMLLPSFIIALASKFILWYISLFSPEVYSSFAEASLFILAFTLLMLLAFVKKPEIGALKIFAAAFIVLILGTATIKYIFEKPKITVEKFNYGYIAKLSDKSGTLILTDRYDAYVSLYGESENVYDLNTQLTLKKENYIIYIESGYAEAVFGENNVIFNTDVKVEKESDVYVSFEAEESGNGDLNIIVTKSGIDYYKEKLTAGNYILTQNITFGFEESKLKFY